MTDKTFKRTRTHAGSFAVKRFTDLAKVVGATGSFASPKTRPEEIKKFVKAERQRDHAARVRVNEWRNSQ